MCGIFAAIDKGTVTHGLLHGLQALAYRGYDSAGIAVINDRGLDRRRAGGKLEHLARLVAEQPIDGAVGIAHTRWATHGEPNSTNAHPHMTEQVAVAHNGIIENYRELRADLQADGYHFESETDSEVIPLMITRCLDHGMDNVQALRQTMDTLEGSFALVAIFPNLPGTLYAARRASPLVLGQTKDGFYLASDANALSAHAEKICHLEDGDLACVQRRSMFISSPQGLIVERPMIDVAPATQAVVDKQGYRHFMLKEIHEQPDIIARTLGQYLVTKQEGLTVANLPVATAQIQRLSIIACGTSLFAGTIGRYWLESIAGIPTDTDIASEYRYRCAPLDAGTRALFISQSGETADTLAALRHAQGNGLSCFSIVNQAQSSMAKESDAIMQTLAGVEIGVASTKAFTAQLAVLLMFTLKLARSNARIDASEEHRLLTGLLELPRQISDLLRTGAMPELEAAAMHLQHASTILYLGRGIAYPLAQEGALKLKEISYIHAEAYPAGELKHGPIALIDEQMPVVMVAPPGPLSDKALSNLREVDARGARVILISNQSGVDSAREHIQHGIVMPDVEPILQPLVYSIPLQLLAYRIAVLKGTDVDQPRNLAKSVTVE